MMLLYLDPLPDKDIGKINQNEGVLSTKFKTDQISEWESRMTRQSGMLLSDCLHVKPL